MTVAPSNRLKTRGRKPPRMFTIKPGGRRRTIKEWPTKKWGGRGDGTSFRSKFMAEFSATDRGDVSTLRDTIGGYKKKSAAAAASAGPIGIRQPSADFDVKCVFS